MQAQSRGGLLTALRWLVVVVVVGGGGWLAYRGWQAWSSRPTDEVFEPQHPVNLDAVDLELVHHELWGRWALHLEHRYELRDANARIEAATKALRDAIAPDKNLLELFDELEALVAEGKLRDATKRTRALWLTRAWNQYLDRHDRAFFVRAFVALNPNPALQLYAYELVGQGQGTVDGDPLRVRLLSRLDEVNRVEWYHASTPTEGAAVRIDPVVQFALDRVWPLLDGTKPKSPRAQLFADAIVAEVKAAMDEATFDVLVSTAAARASAVAAHRAIRERRRCSHYAIARQPWDGFDGDALAELSNHVAVGGCPPIYPSEFKALDEARNVLVEAQGLESALQALAAWAVRGRMIHEVRHVQYGVDLYDDKTTAQCSICAADASNVERAEVAAIVAEWAWTEAPALALLRRCWDEAPVVDGPLATAFKGLGWNCAEGPHPDLAEAAQALEDSAFGGRMPIDVSGPLSAALPLDRSVVRIREQQAGAM